jgi:hypothetical protein
VILSAKSRSLDRFFAALAESKVPHDFLNSTAREQGARERDLLAEWDDCSRNGTSNAKFS